MTWLQVAELAALFGFTTWAGTRLANWQDRRLSQRRFEKLLRDIQQTLVNAREAAEEVKRARQSGSDG